MNTVKQDQRALDDQIQSVIDLATKNGHYDAADWIIRVRDERRAEMTAMKARLSRRPTARPR
jgi:hypothetical protein